MTLLGRSFQGQEGITLIELMIVLLIITIMATSTVAYFERTTTRAKQYEAKQILKQIYEMQRVYHMEYDTYWKTEDEASASQPSTFARIGVIIMPQARYVYQIEAGRHRFTAGAVSKILDEDKEDDVWTIDQDGHLICESDDCWD